MKKNLSIILVNWNCGNIIIDCIQSIEDTVKKHTYEIIVVDNNSSDGSLELIKKKYPEIIIIRNNYNNMFAGANNQGFAKSSGEYVFILNSDTVVTNGAIDKLLDYMQRNKQEVITCKLINRDGSVQYYMHRGFPSFFRSFTSLLYKKYGALGFLPSVKNYLLINNKFDKDFYVEQAAGACILLSRKLIQDLGYLFDEKNFPLFYNDVDLCYRINKKNIKILCKTDISIYHLKGEAIKKLTKRNYLISNLTSQARFFKKYNLYFNYSLVSIILSLLRIIKNEN